MLKVGFGKFSVFSSQSAVGRRKTVVLVADQNGWLKRERGDAGHVPRLATKIAASIPASGSAW
jgi:hypothetical protein